MPDESAPAKSGSKSRSRVFPLLLVAIVITAVAGWFWREGSADGKASVQAESTVKSTVHLETFVMNLADSDQRSYLRVGIDLGVNHEAKRGVEVPVARVRDTILGVLALAKVDDLLTAGGKNKLKQDLQRALEERVPELGVEDVYFTEFLIQR